jgi:phage terminase large subunit
MAKELTIDVDYWTPPVFKPLNRASRYKVYYGGRGGGRSWAFARKLLHRGMLRKQFFLCARELQKSIEDSVYRLLVEQIDLMNAGLFYRVYRNAIVGLNGTRFIFEGLKSNVTKIKSIEGIDVCWVEEAEKVSEDSWDILIPTIRKDGSEIWISFNPDLETDPTYKKFVTNTPPDTVLKKTTFRDNPLFPKVLKLEKDYMYATDPDRADWIWEGNCRSHSDAQIMRHKWIIEDFTPRPNDKKNIWYGPYYGADWGFAKDPTALIKFWIKPDYEFWDLCIEDEAFGYQVDISDTPELFDPIMPLDSKGKPNRKWHIYADNARPETISAMNKAGFNIDGAPKWKGNVEDGITWIRSCRKIKIHPRCTHVIDEAKNYCYKRDKLTDEVLPVVEKGFDHGWDAIRYGATAFIVGEDIDTTVMYDDPVKISPY